MYYVKRIFWYLFHLCTSITSCKIRGAKIDYSNNKQKPARSYEIQVIRIGYRAVSALYRIKAKPSFIKGLESPYNKFKA